MLAVFRGKRIAMAKSPMFYTDAEKTALIEGAIVSLSAGQSLRSYCLSNNVAYATMWEMLNPVGGDNSAYTRAKAAGTHYLADETIDISDLATPEDAQVARLRIDTRLRLIGKWNRKDYGDKTAIVGGDEGDAPVQLVTTDRDRAKAMASLIMKAKAKPAGE